MESNVRDDRFERGLKAIDEVNAGDPNTLDLDGEARPKELFHSERTSHWLETLEPESGVLLRLAVRAHHLRRWSLPRTEYPQGRAGYHAWRRELQNRHAQEVAPLLFAASYSTEEVERVGELIRKHGLGRDPEAQIFEDVLCLVFIETQLESFAAAQEADKVVDILARTLPKMSEREGNRRPERAPSSIDLRCAGNAHELRSPDFRVVFIPNHRTDFPIGGRGTPARRTHTSSP